MCNGGALASSHLFLDLPSRAKVLRSDGLCLLQLQAGDLGLDGNGNLGT